MKIAIIGGGSYTWAFGFLRQFTGSQHLADSQVALMDLDAEALELVRRAGEKCCQMHDSPLKIIATTQLDPALDGADFVLVSISTGGLDAMRADIEIPQHYGVYHTVGDTVGPGGWSRAVRNVPVFHHIASRMKALCPSAWMLNVSNPLSILTRVPHKCFGIKTIGMCPGADGHVKALVRLAGLEANGRQDFTITGIDHGSWLTSLYCDGVDVLAKLKEMGFCRSDDKLPVEMVTPDGLAAAAGSRAIFAVWREIGFMPCINDRHSTENWSWFLAGNPQPGFSIKRTSIADRQKWRLDARGRLEQFIQSGQVDSLGHGDDPVVTVIESLLGCRTFLYTANYRNIGQIPQLPPDSVVETRCLFDATGPTPLASPMPLLLEAMVRPHVLRQEAIIDIALEGDFDQLVALVATDPLCCRIPIDQVRPMVRQMIDANSQWIRNPRLK